MKTKGRKSFFFTGNPVCVFENKNSFCLFVYYNDVSPIIIKGLKISKIKKPSGFCSWKALILFAKPIEVWQPAHDKI